MRLVIFGFLALILPQAALAAVTISEVAWMGDTVSANHEWIELHNSGEAIDVSGWIVSDDMNLTIALDGTIPAGAYVLLERNRSSEAYLATPPFLVYTGALVNTGATLVVRDSTGAVVDQVAGGENWQAIGGDNTTKETAQYTTSGWRTGAPTPLRAGASSVVTTASTTTTTSTSGGSRSGSRTTSTAVVKKPVIPNALALAIELPTLVYVGQTIPFAVTATGVGTTTKNSLTYNWNFGDLSTSSALAPRHTYRHAGTYVVSVEAVFAKQRAVATAEVTVLPVMMSLSVEDGTLFIQNDALYPVDISGYRVAGQRMLTVPPRTTLVTKGALPVPLTAVGGATSLALYDARGVPVAVWPPVVPAVAAATAASSEESVAWSDAAPVSVTAVPAVPAEPVVAHAVGAPVVVPLIQRPTTTYAGAVPAVVGSPDSLAAYAAVVTAALVASTPSPSSTVSGTATTVWPYGALVALVVVTMAGLLVSRGKMMSDATSFNESPTAIHR